MRRLTAHGLAAAALLAPLVVARAAGATPTFQPINTISIGALPLSQSPYAFATPQFGGAATYDGDATKPWLVLLQNQLTPGAGAFRRIGQSGLFPTTTVTVETFSGPGEMHPSSVVVAMTDSYVYRIDAQTGECVWKTYIGRTTATTIHFPGCAGGVPAAEIQCPKENGAAYAFLSSSGGADAASTQFFVPTAYNEVAAGDDPPECGTVVDNRLYALNAATGAPQWVFNVDMTQAAPYATNESPPYPVNGIVGDVDNDTGLWDGCSAVARNRIIFGTIDAQTGQDTLYSVFTDTPGAPGQVEWSAYVGDVQAPLFPAWGRAESCGHLYATTDGNFQTMGTTPAACGSATVPCSLMQGVQLPLSATSTNMFWDSSSPLFGKLLVANSSTIYVVSDDGPTTTLYCTADALESRFPVINGAPQPLGSNVWLGATAPTGSSVVSLAIPTTKPGAPYDCGSQITAFPQSGTVGGITSDINFATGARFLYAPVNGKSGASVVVANYSN
jgi:hypothetical protein